ncbi:carboxylesterase/lipase family protein [Deinococcus lacus]|uniref:Carboxylesterase/lipase family protein n=1 Tax=Deinococcus lacus TaxID=392561 RepID=A0ABW1YEI5_9DEIO
MKKTALTLALSLCATAAAQGFSLTPPPPAAPAESTRVAAPAGPVIGSLDRGLRIWEGIPYAQPPVGDLRWRAPRPLPAWTAEKSALQAGAACTQYLSVPGQGQGFQRGQEDCLTLNVYAPENAQNLPVMVWIHGGSFNLGASTDYDPRALAREQGVVVVSMNYRLGALGFLATPGLEEDGSVGNYGLLDQQLALKWVRQNVAAFGGDAANVTVFGELAGGMSICQQLLMPGSKGLFDKAIIQSGPCTAPSITANRADALKVGAGTAEALGCKAGDAACLRALPLEKVVRATPPGQGLVPASVPFPPIYADPTLPTAPTAAFGAQGTAQAANVLPVPVLIGSTQDESRLFAAWIGDPKKDLGPFEYLAAALLLNGPDGWKALTYYPASHYPTRTLALAASGTDITFSCPTSDIARSRAEQVPTYAYEFRDRNVPTNQMLRPTVGVPSFGAFHSSEVAGILGTSATLVDYSRFTPKQLELARTMRTYWANFARTGNPNGAGLTEWPRLDAAGMNVLAFAPGAVGVVDDFRSFHKCGIAW